MTRTTLVVFSFVFLVACAHEGEVIIDRLPNSCGGTGYTFVFIRYSDSSLVVLPIIKVDSGKELQYRLLPKRNSTDPINYKDSLVTITGVTAPDGGWMDASGTFNDSGGTLKVCAPEDPAKEQYKYQVNVAGVGSLDPRAEVQR